MNTLNPEENQQKTASFEADFLTNKRTDVVVPDLSFTSLSYGNPTVKSGVDSRGVEPPFTDLTDREPHRREPTPSPSYLTSKKHATDWLLFGVAGLVLIILIPPAVVLGTKTVPQSATTVSPLTEASNPISPVSQPAATTKVYAPSDYLYVSQRYFTDAQTLSQKRQQTDSDKKEIIGKLQQAIDTISEGIFLYPKRSELWTQRANIYTAITGIAPGAGKAAASDLEQVQRLTSHKEQTNPSLKGLELVGDQQANSRDVLVASPDEAISPYQDSKESSAFSGTAIMPAGQTSITIENIHVTDAGPIYVVPIRQSADQTNAVLSVVKKMNGSGFTVAIDNPQSTDIPFQYWVTR